MKKFYLLGIAFCFVALSAQAQLPFSTPFIPLSGAVGPPPICTGANTGSTATGCINVAIL